MSLPSRSHCVHSSLLTTPSPHAQDIRYQLRNPQQLFTASTGSRKRVDPKYAEYLALYPAPLVLPDDELSRDPEYPPQSFVTWKNEKERNVVGGERGVVYIAEYPKLDQTMDETMASWHVPIINYGDGYGVVTPPPFEDVLAYLQTFFHDLSVKRLDDTVTFTTWEERNGESMKRGNVSKSKPKSKPSGTNAPPLTQLPPYIGLSSTSTTITTRVRVRHLSYTDATPYLHQLNLNDILDHAIAILPPDAYALLLLVNHDLYEDEDDDFCVGRAYGGSRIAVVSGARYRPILDVNAGIDASGIHSWPASHCKEFVDDICDDFTGQKKKKKQKQVAGGDRSTTTLTVSSKLTTGRSDSQPPDSNSVPEDNTLPSHPLRSAITAYLNPFNSSVLKSTMTLAHLHTRRLCLTASHELLHCFGLDHCVYLACAMQGTASLAEDARQPPYLCPICENKLAAAIVLRLGQGGKTEEKWWEGSKVCEWRDERRKALIGFCGERGKAFSGLLAWYKGIDSQETG